MNLSRWPELEAHFDRVVTMTPDQRARYLAQLDAQPEIQAELRGLLAAADAPEPALGQPALDALTATGRPFSPGLSGKLIGAWRLLEWVGTGGMGEVYRAERADGRYEQVVAMKLLLADALDSLQRFEMERRILAQLEHPGIARLYDAGVTDDSRPYMVMEWVAGIDLVSWCTQQAADLPARLALFLQICEAVSWAHRHLLVHRDIKPANVLVTAEGRVKLLDFGIAKHLSGRDTLTINAPLTPAYAAPEQLSGEPITTTTDVYALGVMLFQLLTGRLPWAGDGASLPTLFKRLMETPAPLPSRAATADSPVPGRALRGDLDAIVGRALRKEPAARYADARELADDIRRYLDHLPVQARAGARSYVLRRYLRRHWLAFATAAVVFAAMAAALAAISWEARKARLEAQRAEAVQTFMVDLFRNNSSRQPDPVKARQTTARALLDIGAQQVESSLVGAPQNKLALLRVFADLYGELALVEEETRLRQQAVSLSRQLYGSDSSELVDDLLLLAAAMRDTPSMNQVSPILEEARTILDRRKDQRSAQRGRLLLRSAELLETADLERAHADAEQAVAIFDALPPSPDLAEALHNLAATESNGGNQLKAIGPLQRAIEVSRATEGATNPQLVAYYYQLAQTQTRALLYAEAEASAREALRLAVAINGEDHVDALRAWMALSLVLVESDRVRAALDAGLQAKAVALRVLGPDEAFHRPAALFAAARVENRAGDLEQGLADVQAALKAVQTQEPHGYVATRYLEEIAYALIEMGRRPEAMPALDEARSYREASGYPSGEFNLRLRIRAALDEGRTEEAKTLLAGIAPAAKGGASASAAIRLQLIEAEIALQKGDAQAAAAKASEAGKQMRSGAQAPYLRLTIADSELLEGQARLRGGDADAAALIVARALATRTDLLLPKSPKIAEAQLALAECELARGRRKEASDLAAQAAAIQAQHVALSERYRLPLKELRAELAKR